MVGLPDGGVVVVRYVLEFAPDSPLYATPTNEPEPWPNDVSNKPRPSVPETPREAGLLPPEVIQRIVRQSFGDVRACYEKALRRDTNLRGRVVVRFVIGLDGRVTWTGDGGSDLLDTEVVHCVIESFRSLVFPPPERGVVRVVYPIYFAPAG
jgi:hypothetical protein